MLVEFAQMRTTDHISVPCRTYSCNNMAEYSVGGSDAAQFTWHWLCASCAIAVVRSALDLPAIKNALADVDVDVDVDVGVDVADAKVYACVYCDRLFANALGLSSHIRNRTCRKGA